MEWIYSRNNRLDSAVGIGLKKNKNYDRARKERVKRNGGSVLNPEKRSLQVGTWIKNAKRTDDDKAAVGSCRKKYSC